MNNKKEIMLNRLSKIIKSDEYLTKEEIINYVFNNIKPNTTKSVKRVKKIKFIKKDNENTNIEDDKKEEIKNKEIDNKKINSKKGEKIELMNLDNKNNKEEKSNNEKKKLIKNGYKKRTKKTDFLLIKNKNKFII